jgi:hypothetical protein
MDNLVWDETGWPIGPRYEYTEEDALKEDEWFKTTCGSCIHFISYHAEAGFCKISELKPCDPKAMIDMFDPKCDNYGI